MRKAACSPSVGQSIPRVDGWDKVRGRTRYAADEPVPGLLHAALAQSTVPRGTITAFDLSEAERMPGVRAIVTPDNCPHLHPLPDDLTSFAPSERRPPLADREVYYAGQHLAIVVADTPEQATAAAAAVGVQYAPQPFVMRVEDVAAEAGEQDGQWVRSGVYTPDHFTRMKDEKLQYLRGWRAVHHDLDVTYRTPVEHHNPIELSSTVAEWESDRLTVHDSTRWIMGTRQTLAAAFGLPQEHVRVLSPFVGGAFGSKAFLWQHVVLCAVAARVTSRPVKLVLSRGQMFTSTGHRPQTVQNLKLAADAEGHLTHLEHHTLSGASQLGNFTEPCGMTSRNLYQCPNVKLSHRVARLNLPTPCFMRAPGESPGVFALECAMDELAYAREIDPLQLRLRNYAERDQDGGKPWSGKHLRECYLQGAERFGWAGRPTVPGTLRRQGRLYGWGMATAVYPGRRQQASARAAVDGKGHVTVYAATHEIGNGVRTALSQIAADSLGLPVGCGPMQVEFVSGDSTYPEAPYTGASQTSATVGSAVLAAAQFLKQHLCWMAASDPASPLHGTRPDEIALSRGWLSCGCASERLEGLLERHPEGLSVESSAAPGKEKQEFSFHSFGAHFCEVSVDEATGGVRVERWTGVFDGGTVLNPQLARSQLMGGILFGIGMALLEETVYDPPGARAVNANLGEYLVPACSDTPEFDVCFLNLADPHLDPFGARGIGELGIVGAPAAVVNAVFHATGRRIRELPLRMEGIRTW